MKKNIFFFFFISALCQLSAQYVPDTLRLKLNTTNDSIRSAAFFEIAHCYLNIDQDSALFYAEKGYHVGQEAEDEQLYADASYNFGYVYYKMRLYREALNYYSKAQLLLAKQKRFEEQSFSCTSIGDCYKKLANTDSALIFYNRALNIRKKVDDYKGQASVLNKIGSIYRYIGQQEKAVNNFFEALAIYDSIGDQRNTSYVYNNISMIYSLQKKYDKAITYIQKALEIEMALKNKHAIVAMYNNVATQYNYKESYDTALYYIEKAEEIAIEMKYEERLAAIYNSYGNAYLGLEDYDKAKFYYEQAMKYSKSQGHPGTESAMLINLGMLYTYKFNEHRKSIGILEKGLEKAQVSKYLEWEQKACKGLYVAYNSLGNSEKALYYFKEFVILKDSIESIEKHKQIVEIETKYETEKKEQEIVLLNKDKELQDIELEKQKALRKNQLYLFIGLIAVILIVVFFLLYRRRLKQKALLEQTLKEQQRIRFSEVVEMQEKERKRFASDLHDGLGQILTTAKLNAESLKEIINKGNDDDKQRYQNSVSLIDNACNEIRNIAYDIMPGSLIRLGLIAAVKDMARKINQSEKIQLSVTEQEINGKCAEELEYNIFRIIQEVVNNILKHSDASIVNINFIRYGDNGVEIHIADNGSKLDKTKIEDSTGGWRNIYTRIAMSKGKIMVNEVTKLGNIVILKF